MISRPYIVLARDLAAGLAAALWAGTVAAEAAGDERMKTIDLPPPRLEGSVSLERALHGRRSVREYAPQPAALAEVSQLLWAAQGITDPREGLRTAPSAGALYPLEVYVAAGHVEGLPAGVYRYRPERHQLLEIRDGDTRRGLARVASRQSFVRDSAAVLVFAAVHARTTAKYGRRGVRYVYMEAGHAAQNVYLQATALGLGAVVVGAFDDEDVQELLGIREAPLYLMPFGHPAGSVPFGAPATGRGSPNPRSSR